MQRATSNNLVLVKYAWANKQDSKTFSFRSAFLMRTDINDHDVNILLNKIESISKIYGDNKPMPLFLTTHKKEADALKQFHTRVNKAILEASYSIGKQNISNLIGSEKTKLKLLIGIAELENIYMNMLLRMAAKKYGMKPDNNMVDDTALIYTMAAINEDIKDNNKDHIMLQLLQQVLCEAREKFGENIVPVNRSFSDKYSCDSEAALQNAYTMLMPGKKFNFEENKSYPGVHTPKR